MTVIDLSRKYFIVKRTFPNGSIGVSRGRILGQVSDIYPLYLANVFPLDGAELSMNVQMIVSLEELQSAMLFDDEILWRESFREITVKLDAAKKEYERARRKIQRQAKVRGAGAVAAAGNDDIVMAVTPDAMAELLRRMSAAAEPAGPDEDDQ